MTPAASVINLLRVLDTHPEAIATLRGRPARHSAVHGPLPFEVRGEDIERLGQSDLHELLRWLLRAETLENDLPLDGIHVSSAINNPDGGEDGRIEWAAMPSTPAGTTSCSAARATFKNSLRAAKPPFETAYGAPASTFKTIKSTFATPIRLQTGPTVIRRSPCGSRKRRDLTRLARSDPGATGPAAQNTTAHHGWRTIESAIGPGPITQAVDNLAAGGTSGTLVVDECGSLGRYGPGAWSPRLCRGSRRLAAARARQARVAGRLLP